MIRNSLVLYKKRKFYKSNHRSIKETMNIEDLFEKYTEWKMLKFFLDNPSTSFYVKELSRRLKVSPGSVSRFVNKVEKDGLLVKDVTGNIHQYRLNNEDVVVRQLKVFNSMIEFRKARLVERVVDENVLSLVLYGSYASGKNDDKSDIDLLVISNKKRDYTKVIQQQENVLKHRVTLEVFTLGEWGRMVKQNKAFYDSVMQNHVLLFGGDLV